MRRSIATVCLSGGLEEKLRAAAAAGFDAVELFENDLVCFDGSPRDIRTLVDDLGLSIDLYQPFRDFEGAPPAQFQRNLDRAERKFDVMTEIGAPMILVCSSVAADASPSEDLAAEQLRELATRAAKRGLRVGYEALAWGRHVNRLRQAWSIVKKADHGHLGVVLDSFHSLALGDGPSDIAPIPGDKIAFLQLADAPRLDMDLLSWSRRYRSFPGQGEFDVVGFVRAAIEAGYAGPLSLEVFNDDFRGGSSRQIARDGYRSLLFLEEQLRRADEEKPKAVQHAPRVDLFNPPSPPDLIGVSFIEFAVDAAAEARFGAWLQTFGFARTGQHRHKAVSLYESGAMHLVLNAEPDSFASSYFLMHGVSVCALGLRVKNAAEAARRAVAYGCQQFEGRAGPNELRIPAIRALDGSLIYFVGEEEESAGLYDIEFDRKAPAPKTAFKVDHLGVALPAGWLESWVLFLRAVLGMRGEDTQTVNDPHGVVRSRVVSDEKQSVRLALNVSLSRMTETAQSFEALAGGGVQQIAFAVPNLAEAVEQMWANKAPLLKFPENYYDDLQARFGLDENALEGLRSGGLLYDRSAAGEFFHAYSETFEGRFFFEFVERAGDYAGYGVPNAPLRLAAQARQRHWAADLL